MSFYNDPYSTSNNSNRFPVAPLSGKVEEELATHIKKALSAEETAPKQKHVRALIVYSWDIKSSGSLWHALKVAPIFGDEIITFKSLITIHKLVRGGHPAVLRDAVREIPWIEQLTRSISGGRGGYGVLIKAYSQFIITKINYHRAHPEFTGTFDYDEYVSLKGIEDPNEGFETIHDLLGLLDKLDSFQKLIFDNFRSSTSNECRIAALGPLVEESYGIYQFLVSMLTAMHQVVGTREVLAPLREKFKAGHHALFRFYYECSNLRYLTQLVAIPKLSPDAPDFSDGRAPVLPPRGARTPTPPASPVIDLAAERALELQMIEQQRYEQQLLDQQRLEEQMATQQLLEQQRQQQQQQMLIEQQRQLELQRQLETENLRQQMGAQLQNQVESYRQQSIRDRDLIENYSQRMRSLEMQLQSLSMSNSAADGSKDELIRRLQDELNQWKSKYEALAKLYAQLRKEHLDLLNKFKEVKDGGGKIQDEAKREIEKREITLRQKQNELTEVLVEKERMKGEVDRVRRQYEDELARLRRDVSESKDQVTEVNNSKRAEISAISARYEHEKNEIEAVLKSKQQQVEDMRKRLEDLTNEMLKVKS
ncbi:sla2 Src-like adaptor 2, partial [Nowakowskiella sp. JEL0078]